MSKPRGYGLTAEIKRKQDGKWNADDANQVVMWISDVLSHGGKEDLAAKIVEVKNAVDVQNQFKTGIELCHLINVLKPGSVKKINDSALSLKQSFKLMENIGNFLAGCGNVGVKPTDQFQTVDLFEGGNIPQVISTLIALGRKSREIPGYDGPTIGPKESSVNKRDFTDEQLRAGEGIINLQAGSNKGASQAGQNFGKTRAIID